MIVSPTPFERLNSMTTRFGVAVVIGVLLVIALSAAVPSEPRWAQASGSEPDAMIWHFNVFRVQHGLPPLYTDPTLMANAQAAAEANGAICSTAIPVVKPGYQHKWSSWSHGGGATADARWPSWEIDSLYPSRILDPEFTSVGVGHAVAECGYQWMWSVALAEVDNAPAGINPTPTGGTNPTPGPLTPTPTTTATVAPTQSTVPTVTPTATPTVTATPQATPRSSATPYHPPNGDVNCDGEVRLNDGMLVLLLAADFSANTPCLGAHGVDCTGLIDEFDVLALFKYLSDLPSGLPEGCTPIGAAETPTPVPTAEPSVTPTATATPAITATPAATQQPGELTLCFLAIASYEVTFAPALNGAASCTTETGVDYVCDFPGSQNSFICESSSPQMPDRDCYVYQQAWAFCGAVGGGTDYQCNNGSGVSQCVPVEDATSPTYDCVVEEASMSCLTEASDHPDFYCTKVEQDFACVVIE